MTKKLVALSLILLSLSACTVPMMAGTGAAVYATKRGAPPPAETENRIPAHESWCYRTMGDIECYAHPQDVPPERLVTVDPPTKHPVDTHAYREAVIEGQQ